MIYKEDRLNHYYSSSGVFDFFHQLILHSNKLSKIIILTFFSIFLIVPLLGGPNESTTRQLESITVFSGLTIVFSLMIIVVHTFAKRQSDPRLKKAGSGIILIISIPILLYLLTIILTFLLGLEVIVVLRAISSVVIIIPLILIIMILVESVIRQGIVKKRVESAFGLDLPDHCIDNIHICHGLLRQRSIRKG